MKFIPLSNPNSVLHINTEASNFELYEAVTALTDEMKLTYETFAVACPENGRLEFHVNFFYHQLRRIEAIENLLEIAWQRLDKRFGLEGKLR